MSLSMTSISIPHASKSILPMFLSWVRGNKIKTSLIGLLSIPVVLAITTLYEAVDCLYRYRKCFGERVPIPIAPAHGIVVACNGHTNKNNTTASSDIMTVSNDTLSQGSTQIPHTFKRYQDNTLVQEALQIALQHQYQPEQQNIQHCKRRRPIRLLVVGDSIARGVGVSKSCTPVLPEIISACLSKSLDGIPVYWSVFGHPGASATFLAHHVEKQKQRWLNLKSIVIQEISKRKAGFNNMNNNNTDVSVHGHNQEQGVQNGAVQQEAIDNSDSIEVNGDGQDQWVQLLKEHKRLYDTTSYGEYDIVIIIHGVNDVKKWILPFINFDELENTKHSKQILKKRAKINNGFLDGINEHDVSDITNNDGGCQKENTTKGFSKDVQRILQGLGHKVKGSIQDSVEKVRANVNEIFASEKKVESSVLRGNKPINDDLSRVSNHKQPMVIMPSLPPEQTPYTWTIGFFCRTIGLYCYKKFEQRKRKVVEQYPASVFCTDAFAPDMVEDFFSKRGVHYNMLKEEDDILLSIIDVNMDDCLKLEKEMKEFDTELESHQKRERIGNERMFSRDLIHPNDDGYNMFGRYLAWKIKEKMTEEQET